MLKDPVRLVRMAAARALAGGPERLLPTEARSRFTAALDEWIAAQRFNADRPEALTNLGALHLERGAIDEATALFQQAIALDGRGPGVARAGRPPLLADRVAGEAGA